MKKKYSIKKRKHFKYIFDNSKQISGRLLRVIYLKNNLEYNRLGVTTNKKIKNKPTKNRAKRLIREAYRELDIKKGYDFVILWKIKEVNVKKDQVVEDLAKILKKADLIDEENRDRAD